MKYYKLLVCLLSIFLFSCSERNPDFFVNVFFDDEPGQVSPENIFFLNESSNITSLDFKTSGTKGIYIYNSNDQENCAWELISQPSFIDDITNSSGLLDPQSYSEVINVTVNREYLDYGLYSDKLEFKFKGFTKEISVTSFGKSLWNEELNCFWGGDISNYHNPIQKDVDCDGDMDIICSYSSSDTTRFVVYENTGTPEYPYFSYNNTFFETLSFSGNYRDFTFIDIDDDSQYEIVIGGEFYKKTNSGSSNGIWEIMSNWKQGIVNNSMGNVVVFGDLDNDECIDLLDLSNNEVYKNIGTKVVPVWGRKTGDWGNFSNNNDATLYDFDQDGDLDLILSQNSGNSLYCKENIGSQEYPLWQEQNYWVADVSSESFTFNNVNQDYYDDIISINSNSFHYYRCKWRPYSK